MSGGFFDFSDEYFRCLYFSAGAGTDLTGLSDSGNSFIESSNGFSIMTASGENVPGENEAAKAAGETGEAGEARETGK